MGRFVDDYYLLLQPRAKLIIQSYMIVNRSSWLVQARVYT